MKTEDTEVQIKFWTKLNKVTILKNSPPAQFKGFMADKAQANWNAIRVVFNDGQPMEGKERGCKFHWEQCLQRHTNKYIFQEHRQEHLNLCRAWRSAPTAEDAEVAFQNIVSWWLGKTSPSDISSLGSWLAAWWHQRVSRWGNFMEDGVNLATAAQIPNTNLSESVHASWLASRGYVNKLSLYDACLYDLTEAVLQSAKCKAYREHNFVGIGPGMDTLMRRMDTPVTSNVTPSACVSAVNSAVLHSGLRPIHAGSGGNNRTMLKRTRDSTEYNKDVGSGSHRPDKRAHTRSRVRVDASAKQNIIFDDATYLVQEYDLMSGEWAIRRTEPGSKIRCQGRIKSNGRRCNAEINKVRTESTIAPCFTGQRKVNGREVTQRFWFCPQNVQHTYYPAAGIIAIPTRPADWPVAKGVNITSAELETLESGNYFVRGITPRNSMPDMASVNSSTLNSSVHFMECFGKHMNRRGMLCVEAETKLNQALQLECDIESVKVNITNRDVAYQLRQPDETYTLRVCKHPTCTCPDFFGRELKRIYIPCKHLMYVFAKVINHDPRFFLDIIQPVLTEDVLQRVLA